MWHRTPSRSGRRNLRFEQFEARRLMAVTTALNSGSLTITGDADVDDIAIVGTANPGEITVTGRNGTEVNGVANGSTTVQGVTAHVNADFGDGDNIINVDNIYLAGHLELFTRAGDDRVVLGATGVVSTTEHCTVRTGAGTDVLRAEDYKVFIVGPLVVLLDIPGGTSGGTHHASLLGASSRTSVAVLGADRGINEILLRGVTSGEAIEIECHAPINNIAVFDSAASTLHVGVFDGQNSVYIDTCFSQFISVSAWNGAIDQTNAPAPYNIDDTVTIARCQTQQIVIETGAGLNPPAHVGGSDSINLYGNNIAGPPILSTMPFHGPPAHVVYIQAGGGNDTVDATYNVALGDWFVSFLDGDDLLSFVGNVVTGFASAEGGSGTNRLNLVGNQFGGFATGRFS